MVFPLIFLTIMFLGYHYLTFEMVDTFLDHPRLKKVLRIPVGIVNTLIAALMIALDITSFWAYVLIGLILLVEFALFYQDKLLRCFFCMLAYIIHIMSVRSFCVAAFAIATDSSMQAIVDDPFYLVVTLSLTFLFLNASILGVIKLLPAKSVRIITQHNEQLWFMTAWMSIFALYLLFNANVYRSPHVNGMVLVNQITAPAAVLLGTYIILFFSIRTSSLLGHKEINEKLQHTVDRERQYRASVDKDVFRIIEVNFSKDQIISGFEDYEPKLGPMIYRYKDMLAYMIKETVHTEDAPEFTRYSSPLAVISEFEQGNTEVSFDYRRLMPDGVYVWMHVLMPLMVDEETGDVRGFLQIKNIDAEKKQQLELLYKAERDLLTGLYNKGTTEKLISEYLASNKNTATQGVLFVIDIDNFKNINDRLGHLYGDAVLSELSESLKIIFKETDIVGRIGGDEFLVFAKGSGSQRMITKKANAICKAFLRTYTNEKNEGCTVSGSIGISIFPKDGANFEMLFKCADTALYTTKAKGKNSYSLYEKEFGLSYVSTRTEIDTHGLVQKSFKDNRIEYVFRLLYGSDDTKFAIESVLELIAKNFGFSRANIFEFNELSTHFNGVFEWCANGIDSVIDNYINMPVSDFDFVISSLEKSGGMFYAVPTDFPEYAQESYTSIGIKSIVHFSIKERDSLIGVVAFQNCTYKKSNLTETEFDELRTICQVLSIFMAKQLSSDREQRHHQAIETVMDNMNSIAYVIDRETFDVYYENNNVVNITGHSSIGTKCHISYRGLQAPCEDCPLNHLSQENPRITLELYTEKFDIYTKTSASLIDWVNDKQAMLISSVDITEYVKESIGRSALTEAGQTARFHCQTRR